MLTTTRSAPVSALVLALVTVLAACAPAGPDNRPPIVRIEGPTTVATDPGQPVPLRGSAEDPDGDTVTLSWELGDGSAAKDTAEVQARFEVPGVYRVVLHGRDARGAAATPAETLVQVGMPTATAGNLAMRFDGTGSGDADRVKIPVDDPARVRTFASDVGATDMTVEFWLRARAGANAAGPVECGAEDAWINGNVVLDRDRFGQGRKFGLSVAGGVLVFGLTGEDEAISLCGRTPVDDDRWHHVALTRRVADGALALYVDGRLDSGIAEGPAGDVSYPDGAVPQPACNGGQPCSNSDPYLVIGAEKHDVGPEYPSFQGLVDELRLSTTIRYAGPFAPPARAFTPDPDTAALYHFDEGGGPVVRDAGPAGSSDGVVRGGGPQGGATWVPSDAPTVR